MTGDYQVGYGKPPTHTRFKAGRSGNPLGRPKCRKNFETELLEELQGVIAVREGGRRHTVSKQRAMLKALMAKALQGDTKAAALIANLVIRILQKDQEPEEEQDLTADDRAILADFEKRIRSTPRVRHRTRPAK